ncbi:Enhancer of polycomb protein [Dioscorea alata]|uniref:Enhancer of polycomb protein n=2 Tax=Dioscorea alata TaxID=55571 RepID=A0ACB7WA47_DIOAL|nr:Enhancer of polycomb protein [Dioscorea alata]KAH7684281.1 Enhancer of polycomb protein [Dioscorea alata]
MSRLSFRPRPLDIHKKLPIVKSVKEFEDDEAPVTGASTRNSQLLRLAAETEIEVQQNNSKKNAQEIPTPQCSIVDTYERDYLQSFSQPASYLRGRGARAEIGEFVEYDLDDEDEDWLLEYNNDKKILAPEKFEALLFKLEVFDHKAREKAGIITLTLGSSIPVLLQLDAAAEVLQSQSTRFPVFQSVYNYWKEKRERWQKPILRRLQPPPAVNDTNPYNVFRPREKAHRLHTRRMQRRENNVQSFEKLRQVRRNLDQAKTLVEALIKREEKKREVMENDVALQRIQIKYQHEAQLVEDGLALSGFPLACKFGSSEDDPMDSDDAINGRSRPHPTSIQQSRFTNYRRIIFPTGRMTRDLKRRHLPNGWLQKRDPLEPVLLFTKPLDPEKLTAAGIIPPPDPTFENGSTAPPFRFQGRIGRGGRIIFDRVPIGTGSHVPPNTQPLQPNG